MSVYYIRHLYIHIMFKKCQKHVKIIFIKDKNKIKFFVRMKTFSLILQGLKSKFVIFIGTKNLFNP